MNPSQAVGLIPHRERPLAHTLARDAAHWFTAHDVEVRVPREEAAASGLEAHACDTEKFVEGLDLVITLGGDGTMLHTVQLVYPDPVPVLGVNAGQLGYLTALEPEEFDGALPRLLTGDYSVSERMMLEVVYETRGGTLREYALNETVLEKREAGHLVRFDLSINGSAFTTYAADGVIVATPTGSTAYSFSARGPIASPALRCLMLTPISPHMLFDRSLVLAEHEELDFVVSGNREVVATMDGRRVALLVAGDRVTCRAAAEPMRMVEMRSRDFHQILRAKFDLPDR
ncbi:MAG: NAD(+)/NADH kinase [Acidimicrobiia bacterium]